MNIVATREREDNAGDNVARLKTHPTYNNNICKFKPNNNNKRETSLRCKPGPVHQTIANGHPDTMQLYGFRWWGAAPPCSSFTVLNDNNWIGHARHRRPNKDDKNVDDCATNGSNGVGGDSHGSSSSSSSSSSASSQSIDSLASFSPPLSSSSSVSSSPSPPALYDHGHQTFYADDDEDVLSDVLVSSGKAGGVGLLRPLDAEEQDEIGGDEDDDEELMLLQNIAVPLRQPGQCGQYDNHCASVAKGPSTSAMQAMLINNADGKSGTTSAVHSCEMQRKQWLDGHLSDLILKAYTHRRQEKSMLVHKYHLQEAISACLACNLGPGMYFNIFLIGSSLTNIGSRRSDIDLCMVIYDQQGRVDERYNNRLDAEAMLTRISDVLEQAGLAFGSKVIRANVPIVKFYDRHGIEVNLNLNKLVTIQNSLLLVYYCSLDARVAPFLFIVKLWAQKNGINCAYFKSLSSYSLSLMAIFYLSAISRPAVLPNFSEVAALGELFNEKLFNFFHHPTCHGMDELIDKHLHVTSSHPMVSPPSVNHLRTPHYYVPMFRLANFNQHDDHGNGARASFNTDQLICKVTFLTADQAKHKTKQQCCKYKTRHASANCNKTLLDAPAHPQLCVAAFPPLPPHYPYAAGHACTNNVCDFLHCDTTTSKSEPASPSSLSSSLSSCSSSSSSCHLEEAKEQQPARSYKSKCTSSLGLMFSEFIEYYAQPSVYDSVISVRTGKLMKRTDPTFAIHAHTSMETFICVEEPFNHTNTSHSVHNDFMFHFICRSFRWTRDNLAKMKMTLSDFV